MIAGALVLAAGSSRRFGSDKRRYPLDGSPMLVRRPGEGDLPLELGLAGLEIIECPGATRGMGATLADGARACGDWDGLLVVLGDMPWITPDTYRQLMEALSPERIVQPAHDGRPGHPVGFGSAFFPALQALDGDQGGRAVIEENTAALLRIPVNDPGIHRDLDEPSYSH